MNAVDQLIKAAGGLSALAGMIKSRRPGVVLDGKGVYNWRRRGGVPAAYVKVVDEIAEALGRHELIDLLESERMATTQSKREAA